MKRGKITKLLFNYRPHLGDEMGYEVGRDQPYGVQAPKNVVTEIVDCSEEGYSRHSVFFQDGACVDVYNPSRVFYAPPEVKNGKN